MEDFTGILDSCPDPLRYKSSDFRQHEAYQCIASFILNRSRVLDIGCGSGELLRFLKSEKQCRILGLEPNHYRAIEASSATDNILAEYLTHSFALENAQTFDHVILADVIEHIAWPAETLRLAGLLLRENGNLIVSVPNIAHWSIRLELMKGLFKYEPCGILDATHLRFYTLQSLKQLLTCNGYRLDFHDITFTAGKGLPCYSTGLLRRLPPRILNSLVDWLSQRIPTLFACQFVCRLTKAKANC